MGWLLDNHEEKTRWTEQQLAVFEHCCKTELPLVVVARAGSGKTTTLIESIVRLERAIRTKVLGRSRNIQLIAFNKKVNEEAERRLRERGSKCVVQSFNAKGYAWVRAKWRSEFDAGKQERAIKVRLTVDSVEELAIKTSLKLVKTLKIRATKAHLRAHVRQVVGLVRGTGAILADYELERWTELVCSTLPELFYEELSVDWDSDRVRTVTEPYVSILARASRDVVRACDSDRKTVDYSDQVRFPVIYDLCTKRNSPPILFVEEAQDISLYQLVILNQMVEHGTRLICVGDPKQAIYAFRGARKDSMDQLIKLCQNQVLSLSKSFRCPDQIVDYVKARCDVSDLVSNGELGSTVHVPFTDKWAKKLKTSRQLKKLQAVLRDKTVSETDLDRARTELDRRYEEQQQQSRIRLILEHSPEMIISAKNRDLLALLIDLVELGRSVALANRGQIPRLIGRAVDLQERYDDLDWTEFVSHLSSSIRNPKVRLNREKFDELRSLKLVIDRGVTSWSKLFRVLKGLDINQSDDAEIMLYSVHACKGLEARSVFVLDTFFDSAQVVNMEYVALTRAREVLYTELRKVAKKQLSLTIELIPLALHRLNLRAVLNKGEWESCKNLVKERSQGRCEICGDVCQIECHEQWQKERSDNTGKLILIGLLGLCRPCHLVKHYGYATVTDQTKLADTKLLTVNNWKVKQLEEHVQQAFKQYEADKKLAWSIDMTWITTILHLSWSTRKSLLEVGNESRK